MTPNEIINRILQDSFEWGYTIYSVAPFAAREGNLPGALVLTNKVNNGLAIHDVYITRDNEVTFMSGIYPRASLEQSMKFFGQEIFDAAWRFE